MKKLKQRNQERLSKSFSGQRTGEYAFHVFISYPFVLSATNVSLIEYFTRPEVMLETQLELLDKLEGCFEIYPDYAVVPECHALGAEMVFDKKGFPSTKPLALNDIDDVRKLKPADPYGGSYMTNALMALSHMKQKAPAECNIVCPTLIGPVTVASMLRGINEFCTDLYDQPEMIEALLDVIIETQIRYLKAQEKIMGKIDRILIGDDIASFLNLDFFHRFVKPGYEQIFKEFPNAKRWYHNDADAHHLPKAIEDCGFEMWHAGYCLDILDARKKMDGKTCIFGNLSPISLVTNNPDEVRRTTAELLESFGGDPKFVVATGGFISYGTPVENVLAMMHTVDQYHFRE